VVVVIVGWKFLDLTSITIPQMRVGSFFYLNSHGGVFQGIFPWLIALCQSVLSQRGRKWLKLPSKIPHNLWTARRKAEVQPWTDDG